MAVNKVDVNGITVLDLTQDSVTPVTLKKGETAHDSSGAAIVGEMESSAPSLQSKSVTYTANGTATITPDEGYDGLSSVDVAVNVSGGGGEVSSGHSVTFPATANNWDKILNYAVLVLSDGSTVDFKNYSVVAGRTINNVIDIRASAKYYYLLRLTLTAGAIVVANIASGGTVLSANMTEAPGSTQFYYAADSSKFSFMPVEDIIISTIELIYTYD